jgi:hypothetical protein
MTTKRDAPISYRPPQALRAEFHARVERSGLSASGYITQCVFAGDGPRAARGAAVDRQLIAKLLSETAALHDRLRALAEGADPVLLAEAVGDLREMRAACLLALGRKP